MTNAAETGQEMFIMTENRHSWCKKRIIINETGPLYINKNVKNYYVVVFIVLL